MEPDFSKLDDYVADEGVDGYLIDDDAENSDQKYLSGFDAPDPFVTLYTPEKTALLVSGLEYGRARKESRADVVDRYGDYDYRKKIEEHGAGTAKSLVLAEFCAEHGVESVAVPARFPVSSADGLRENDVEVFPETDGVVTEIRATKTEAEIEHVRAAQEANEKAMAAAEALIEDASVEDGVLHHGGEPLTAERVKEQIELTLLRNGCALDETIVACGEHGADPHDRGTGPLEADELIVIDVFPKNKETGYHGDMTRTFIKGEPTEEQRRRYEITERAVEAAFDAIEPGATGGDVHDAVCDVYEEEGYATLRSDETTETGFIHSTGHGVGLDVHELPSVSPNGDELEPGHVITIEPGLYDPAVGGVRIEDMVVVTEDGFENLTDYPVELVVD
ncbi:MAG: M24 family metallopeptidase [Halanaeroarchaeum sp.]